MIQNLLVRRAAPLTRKFSSTSVRCHDFDNRDIAGSTLPFGINNPNLLTLGFCLFFGSGLAIPFLILKRNTLKQ